MKTCFLKKLLLLTMAIVLVALPLISCQQQEQTPTTEPPVQIKEDYIQLLGFESYAEITGAKIAMGNMFGRMQINTDKAYITQGEGSLMVTPQGDYGNPKEHPYFKLDFLNTTCTTCNFSEFKHIAFDVYNASDEQLQINVSLNVGKNDGYYISTIKETYDLTPNSWTTCVYDLSVMAGMSMYDFANVRYLTVEFLNHKENREDQLHSVYIDNLIGKYYEEGEKPTVITYDFYEGIGFENSGEELLFTGQGKNQDAVIDRIPYADTDLEIPEGAGEYALRLSHATNYWPTFRINFGEEYAAGTVISFMAYARIDGESLYDQSIFEFSDGGEATLQFKCGIWTELSFTLKTAGSHVDLFWNFDRAQITSDSAYGEVYIDNIVAADPEPPIEPEGDFWKGIDFETIGNIALFEGQKVEGALENDATIERVAYSELDIPKLQSGGEYAMRLSHVSFLWPAFRVNFGQTLPKGTIIRFMAYARITDGTSNFDKSIFEYSGGVGEATDEFPCGQWVQLEMELPETADHIDMFWNYDRAQITSGTASAEVYVDNIIATPGKQPIPPEGDILEGWGFEILGNVGYFVELDIKDRDAIVERVRYADAGITPAKDGGEYALKLTHDSNYWPAFRINFGKTLPAGMELSFMVYSRDITDPELVAVGIFERVEGGELTAQYYYNNWTKLSIVLEEACSYIDMVCTLDRWEKTSSVTDVEVYIDNFIASEPSEPGELDPDAVGNFSEGVDFETQGNELMFGEPDSPENAFRYGVLERVSYADAGITPANNGGEYALKLTHGSSYWPVFRINFGEELPAGTELSFDVYSRDITDPEVLTVGIFERVEGGELTAQYYYNNWTSLCVTLESDCNYIDLVCTMDRWEKTSAVTNVEVYMDNFLVGAPSEPGTPEPGAVGNLSDGIDFETEGNELLFGAVGGDNAWRDASFERLTYEAAGVAAPANGGDYVLKLTCGSSQWPVFRLNFGQELEAGTVITFDAFTDDTSGIRNTVSIFEYVSGGEATVQYHHGSWNTLTITLAETCSYVDLMCNMDRWSEPGPANLAIYMDNFRVEGEDEPEATEPEDEENISGGFDFEVAGHETFFTGVGGDNAWRDASFERLTYEAAGVAAPANGGEYVLKLTCGSSQWPVFRLNFGQELEAGTVITFDAFTDDTSGIRNTVSIFEYVSGGEATAQYHHGSWNTLTITLAETCSYVDLMCNMDRWSEPGPANLAIYLDNFRAAGEDEPETTEPDATEPEDEENISGGFDFEAAGHEDFFTGVGGDNAWRDASFERLTYEAAGVAAPANGGDYVLKLTCGSSQWPVFRLNFGQELEAGTVITFDAFTDDTSGIRNTVSIFEYVSGGEATAQYHHGSWNTLTITLAETCSYVDLMCNMDRWSEPGPANLAIYMDNFRVEGEDEPEATEPEDEENISGGFDFEAAGHETFFTGVGGDNAWRDASFERLTYEAAGVAAPANGGEYVLKLTCGSSQWPVFRLNFGQELEAGTVITFDAFTDDTSGIRNTVSIFEYVSGGEATAQYHHGSWNTLTITLAETCSYVDLMCNMDRWSEPGPANLAIYMDNFQVVGEEPEAVESICDGFDFEAEGQDVFFTGVGGDYAWRDATFARVSYTDAGIAAGENGGEYALKLTCSNSYWPTFRLNFGKVLSAGTVITFDAYSRDITTSEILTVSVFEYVSGGEATAQYYYNSWNSLSITLATDCEYLDLVCTLDRWNKTSAASNVEVYLDNFKATEPAQEIEPAGDILEGYGFETAGNELRFTGTDNPTTDATVERVSYEELGIEGPADGGSYALKVSHDTYAYPTFRIDFGKTLKAGTTINFDAYAIGDGSAIALMNSSWTQAAYLPANAWRNDFTWEITLSADCSYIDMLWESRGNTNVASAIIIDNIIATEPGASEETGFAKGVDFESAEDLQYFGAVGGGNAWRDATLEIVSFDGDNALKLTCASSYWPTFRLSFGETLPAGTVITFDAFTRDITTTDITTVSIFEYVSGGEATAQYYYNSWNSLSFTLASDCSYIDLVCTLDRWEKTSAVTNVEVYMDNFRVQAA